MASMSSALITHKRITTTLAKAKALRGFVEPIINRSKDDSTQSRRQAFRRLQDKEAVKTLFSEIANVVGDRPGGYTRVVKLGQRSGDAAEMAIIELVDFNDVKPEGSGTKRKTRRGRRSSGASASAAAPKAAPKSEEPAVEEPVAEAPVDQEAEAVASDAANPDATGNPQVAPAADEHQDAEQGAAAGTGEPGPGADAENQGRSGEAR